MGLNLAFFGFLEEFTIASCRPMLPTVTPPEKNMQGSQERTYRKSGDVYLGGENS